jgi:hypothetical protein
MRNTAGTHPNVHVAMQMVLLKAAFSHLEGGGR